MTFGENLRREREMRGVELREIAEATKISIRFLQALETDRTEVLPGGTFPQAFVRQYARHLGLDADKVVADFVYAHREAMAERAATAASDAVVYGGAGAWPARIAAVAAVLVVGLGVFAWSTRGPAPDPEPVVSLAPAPPAVLPSDRVYPPPSSSAAPDPAGTSGLVLTLQPRQSCWVKLQADRVTVLNRILAQGESQTFEAKQEIVLNVGNAGGLAYTLNGRPGISLGKEGEVRTNIVITPTSVQAFLETSGPRPVARTPAPATAPPTPAAPPATTPEPETGRR